MQSFDVEDTIAAIASPPGAGLRGIIRISGPKCLTCLQTAFRDSERNSLGLNRTGPAAQSRNETGVRETSTLGDRRPFRQRAAINLHPPSAEPLWLSGELLVWPSGRSYTRQPSAEFHTLGSRPLLAKCLARICDAGSRIAQPGEFTLRAFLSGRIDLPQAEAVLSIIDAQVDSQLQVALKQLAGGLSDPLKQARDQLAWMLAEIEAGLDFVEEDIEFLSRPEILRRLSEIEDQLAAIVEQIRSRNSGSQTIRLALVGLPNAGKSSIFNQLLGAGRAIVSNISGTTTDFLVGELALDGVLVELIDTAGWESGDGNHNDRTPAQFAQVHRAAIEAQSQIRLLCVDGSVAANDWLLQQIGRLDSEPNSTAVTMVVLTKCDLPPGPVLNSIDPQWRLHLERMQQWVNVQLPAPDGLHELRQALRRHVMPLLESQAEIVGSTLVRAEHCLRAAWESVARARQAANFGAGEEIVAAEIRGALDEIGIIVGTVYADDILDLVFSRFCIGK